jgi:hypothetical protein
MLREEWRMHSTLFGGARFAGFAGLLTLLAAVGAVGLSQIGITVPVIGLGVVVLGALLGAQTGSLGFEGRDALENLIGDVTPLVYSSRTLPLSGRAAFVAFVLKDYLYYSLMFLLPISLGSIGGAGLESLVAGGTSGLPSVTVATLGWTLAAWGGSSVAFLGGLLAALVVSGVPVAARAVGRAQNDGKTTTDRYSMLSERLGGLTAKSILDIHRSSGGVWKLLLSSATLVGASYVALELVAQHIPIIPSYGVLSGVFLSVTAFPTYSWLTQADGPAAYQLYPVSTTELVTAKARAFAVLQLPVVAVYSGVGSLALSPSALDLFVGTAVLLGLLVYVFGLTVALTGFEPDEYLFDAVVFGKYAFGIVVALLPPMMAGLFTSVTGVVAVGLVVYATLFAILGLLLFDAGRSRLASQSQA